jgi:hypothetical protein
VPNAAIPWIVENIIGIVALNTDFVSLACVHPFALQPRSVGPLLLGFFSLGVVRCRNILFIVFLLRNFVRIAWILYSVYGDDLSHEGWVGNLLQGTLFDKEFAASYVECLVGVFTYFSEQAAQTGFWEGFENVVQRGGVGIFNVEFSASHVGRFV